MKKKREKTKEKENILKLISCRNYNKYTSTNPLVIGPKWGDDDRYAASSINSYLPMNVMEGFIGKNDLFLTTKNINSTSKFHNYDNDNDDDNDTEDVE